MVCPEMNFGIAKDYDNESCRDSPKLIQLHSFKFTQPCKCIMFTVIPSTVSIRQNNDSAVDANPMPKPQTDAHACFPRRRAVAMMMQVSDMQPHAVWAE